MSIRDFTLKIGGAVDPSLKKAFGSSSKELQKLSNEMKDMKKQERYFKSLTKESLKLENQFQKGRVEYKQQQVELIATSNKVNQLKKTIESTKKPTKAMINEFKRAKKAEERLKESTQKQRLALADQMRQMKKAKEETLRYSRSQDDLAKSMEKVRAEQEKIKKYNGLKQSVSNNAGGVFAKSAGEAAALGIAVKFAIDEEDAFADVKKVFSFKDKLEMTEFKKQLKKETKDIPIMVGGIFEIASAAGQAGIDKLEVPEFTVDTAKVAVAFDMDAGTSGEMLATWREAFKMNQKEVMTLADKMNLLGDSIKVRPAQVGEVTTAVGALGKLANFSEAKTAALGGTLIALGVKDSSTASTALRKLYGTLASGEAATSSVSSAFKKMGLEAIQVSKDLQEDSEGTLMKVFKGLNKLEKYEQLSVVKELFGEEAMSSMGLLISNTKFLEENLKLVGDASKYSGSVINEYNNKLDTTKTDLILVGKSLASTASTLTSIFLPPIRAGANGLKIFSEGLANFAEESPKMAKALGFGAAGFIGLKLGVSGTVLGIRQLGKTKDDLVFLKDTAMLVKGWGKWGPLLSGLKTGVVALGTAGKALLFNPWVLGIGAVVAAGYLIYKNWDTIKGGFIDLKGSVIQGMEHIGKSLSAPWNAVKIGFSTTYKFISDKLKVLWELWKKFTIPGKIFSLGMEKYKEWQGKRGKNTGTSTKEIPAYAKGGVVSKPHLALVGDGRTPESIIPHDRSRRSQGLWFNAGQRMGMFAGNGIPALASKVQSHESKINSEYKIEINSTFNPVIHEGTKDTEGLLRNLLSEHEGKLEDLIEKIIHRKSKEESRLSFS